MRTGRQGQAGGRVRGQQGDQGRAGTGVQHGEESNPVDKGKLGRARSRNKRVSERKLKAVPVFGHLEHLLYFILKQAGPDVKA